MNWLDAVLAVVVLTSVVASIAKGFTREAVGLASAVIGIVAAIWFHGTAGSFLLPYVSSKGVANFCGFLIVFFGILVAGSIVGWLMGKVVRASGLSWFDRLLGAVFGFVRGVLASVAIVMAILAFAPGVQGATTPPRAVVESRFAPYMVETANALTAIAPRELKDEFAKRYDELKKIWRNAVKRSNEGNV